MTHPQGAPAGVGAHRPTTTSAQRTVGLLLLLPAVLAWITYQVVPVLRTLWLSLRQTGSEGDGAFVGLENFSRLPADWFTSALSQLLLGLLIAAVAVTLGIVLGGLTRRAPIGWQRLALGVAGLGLVTYAPLNLTFALYWSYGQPAEARLLLAMVPIPLMIGLLAAALARSDRLLLVIGAVTALGGAAWAVQGEISILMSVPPQVPPGAFIYRATFSMLDIGSGAAASTIIGLLLGVLGLGAGLMLLAIRPRFDLTGAPHAGPHRLAGPVSTPTQSHGLLAIGGSVLLLVLLLVLALPWLPLLGSTVEGLDPASAARATWSTVGRRALDLVLTIVVTGAAALGLGYFRPFGRHSVRVLLVVSPWLFVGLIPLMTGLYMRFGGLQEYSGAPFFGITAQMLAIPLLFLLTYVADGMRTARDAGARVPVGSVVGAMVLGIGIVALVRSQEVVWDVVFLYDRANSALQMLFQVLNTQFGQTIPIGLVTPAILLVLGALVLAGAAALVPGVRLVPAEELARQQAELRQPDPRQAQHGHAEYGHFPGGQSAGGQYPVDPRPYPQPGSSQHHPQQNEQPGEPVQYQRPGTWTDPHR